MGFGCTTPAVMAARGMGDERERRLTVLLIPFMSCSARLPIYALFAGVFFKGHENVAVDVYKRQPLCLGVNIGGSRADAVNGNGPVVCRRPGAHRCDRRVVAPPVDIGVQRVPWADGRIDSGVLSHFKSRCRLAYDDTGRALVCLLYTSVKGKREGYNRMKTFAWRLANLCFAW